MTTESDKQYLMETLQGYGDRLDVLAMECTNEDLIGQIRDVENAITKMTHDWELRDAEDDLGVLREFYDQLKDTPLKGVKKQLLEIAEEYLSPEDFRNMTNNQEQGLTI